MAIPLSRNIRMHESRWTLWPPAIILAALLVGGPGYRSPRSLYAAWDLGHVVAFSLWSYLLVTWNPMRGTPPVRQWEIVLAFCLVAGTATEGIQSLLGGDASLGDLMRDIVGGVIAMSWLSPTVKILPERLRRGARTFAASLLLVACIPLVAALSDEGIARFQFPVLSDFETPFEADRWDGEARFSLDRSVARHGKSSMRVDLDTSLYSGVALVYLPRNWRGFRSLKMDVLNPSPEDIDITCRIHDQRHDEGDQRYEDRYNKVLHLRSGWNEIRVDLGEVARAPAGRTLDLGTISAVGVFATRLRAPRTIFLDHVRLE